MVWNEPGKSNGDKDPWKDGHSPDIEKLIKNLQQHLAALFGGGRRGSRRGRGASPHFSLVWIVPLLVIAWLASGFFTVAAGDRAVVLVFGRGAGIVQPGLHWRYPWPVGAEQLVAGVDQGRDYTHQYAQLVTLDGNLVTVAAGVHYQISNLDDYLFKVSAPGTDDGATQRLLAALADSAIRTAVARTSLEDMLGSGRDQAEALARDLLQTRLQQNNAGIAVTRLAFQHVDVPGAVSDAYADVRRAREDAREAQDQARVYANRVVALAKGERDAEVTEADAYRVTRTAEARADAAGFEQLLSAYRAEPALTRRQMYLHTLGEVLGKADKVIVNTSDGNVSVHFVPSAPVTTPPAGTLVAPAAASVKRKSGAAPAAAGGAS